MSAIYDERQQHQAEDEAYRQAAARLFPGVTVSQQASVQRTAANDGAFLQVTVFVPRAELQSSREN